jgi:hypothetical protein
VAYIDERLDLIDKVPSTFVTRVDAIRGDLFDELSTLVASLDSKGGRLVASPENLARVEELVDALGGFLFNEEAEYLAALQEFIAAQGIAASLTDDYLGATRTDKWRAVLRSQQFKTAKIFDKERVSAEIGTLIRNEITNLVASEAPVADASIFLRDFVNGTDEIDGRLTRYVKTWAMTSYSNAERQYVFTAAVDVGVQRWLYSGGTVKDSRDFCVQRVGQTFTTEEVKAWASLDWAGKIAGTDENTIFSALGGWQCQHVLMPLLDE